MGGETVMSDDIKYLTTREVEALTGIKKQTLVNNRSKKKGMPYSKVGRSVRYNQKDVLAYMEEHKILCQ